MVVNQVSGAGTSRAMSGWRPIGTRPDNHGACWIGHSASHTMLVAYPSKVMLGHWCILWSDRLVPWLPDVWQPLPEPPHD